MGGGAAGAAENREGEKRMREWRAEKERMCVRVCYMYVCMCLKHGAYNI